MQLIHMISAYKHPIEAVNFTLCRHNNLKFSPTALKLELNNAWWFYPAKQ